MECPVCKGDIDIDLITMELDAEEDGLELGFTCDNCGGDFFSVLKSDDFEPVD